MHLEFGVPFHHMTIDECRAAGRRGGLRAGRNRRLARPPAPTTINPVLDRETARQAIEKLDQKFPWLRGAELRSARRQSA